MDHIQKSIQLKYVIYQMGQTQKSCGLRQFYSTHLNTLDRDLAANHPENSGGMNCDQLFTPHWQQTVEVGHRV